MIAYAFFVFYVVAGALAIFQIVRNNTPIDSGPPTAEIRVSGEAGTVIPAGTIFLFLGAHWKSRQAACVGNKKWVMILCDYVDD